MDTRKARTIIALKSAIELIKTNKDDSLEFINKNKSYFPNKSDIPDKSKKPVDKSKKPNNKIPTFVGLNEEISINKR